jgi:proteasome beta subunit
MEKNLMKTGTTTLGIKCKDGVVIAADKRATLGGMIVANKKEDKVKRINDNIILTIAGNVSDAQLLTKVIRAQIKLEEIRRNRDLTVKEVANMMSGLNFQNIRQMTMFPGIVEFLLAGKDEDGFHFYDIGIDGSMSTFDDYYCTGSGMMYALGVLESAYKEDMTTEAAVPLAIKAVNAAIQRDTGSGNGIDVYTVTKDGAKKVITKTNQMRIEA